MGVDEAICLSRWPVELRMVIPAERGCPAPNPLCLSNTPKPQRLRRAISGLSSRFFPSGVDSLERPPAFIRKSWWRNSRINHGQKIWYRIYHLAAYRKNDGGKGGWLLAFAVRVREN
jgi:hypothetical protein